MSVTNSSSEHFLPKSGADGNLIQSRFSDGDLDGGNNSHIDNIVGPIRIGDCRALGNGTNLQIDDVEKRIGLQVNGLGDDAAALLMETVGAFLQVTDGFQTVAVAISVLGTAQLGATGGNGTKLFLSDAMRQLVFQCLTVEPESDGVTSLGTAAKSFKHLFLDSTITDEITGNRTINKACGTVWFASGASELTVTNSLVGAESFIFPAVHSDDATAEIKNVTRQAGSFTIRLKTPATNDTEVAFWVLN